MNIKFKRKYENGMHREKQSCRNPDSQCSVFCKTHSCIEHNSQKHCHTPMPFLSVLIFATFDGAVSHFRDRFRCFPRVCNAFFYGSCRLQSLNYIEKMIRVISVSSIEQQTQKKQAAKKNLNTYESVPTVSNCKNYCVPLSRLDVQALPPQT